MQILTMIFKQRSALNWLIIIFSKHRDKNRFYLRLVNLCNKSFGITYQVNSSLTLLSLSATPPRDQTTIRMIRPYALSACATSRWGKSSECCLVLMSSMQNALISGLRWDWRPEPDFYFQHRFPHFRPTELVRSAAAMHQTIFKRFPNNIPVGPCTFQSS